MGTFLSMMRLSSLILSAPGGASYKIAPRFYMTSAAGGLKKGNSYTIKLLRDLMDHEALFLGGKVQTLVKT
jgi:hypothetical protein